MNEALATLSRTDGVVGVVVFDDSGRCVANDLPPPYEPIQPATASMSTP